MNKKIILFVILYVALPVLGIISCKKRSYCGGLDQYKVTSVKGEIFRAEFDNSDFPSLHSVSNNTFLYSEFAIRLDLIHTTYALQRSVPIQLISSAYACDLPATTRETVDSVKIICDRDFSLEKPAGTDMADLFDVVVTGAGESTTGRTDLKAYMATKPEIAQDLIFLLKSAPEESGSYAFKVQYYQKGVSFDYFEYTTPIVTIEK